MFHSTIPIPINSRSLHKKIKKRGGGGGGERIPPTNHLESCKPGCPESWCVLFGGGPGRRRTCAQQCTHRRSRMSSPSHSVAAGWESAPVCSFPSPSCNQKMLHWNMFMHTKTSRSVSMKKNTHFQQRNPPENWVKVHIQYSNKYNAWSSFNDFDCTWDAWGLKIKTFRRSTSFHMFLMYSYTFFLVRCYNSCTAACGKQDLHLKIFQPKF